MSGERVLDDLSGFEFEELMMDVFRNLGYGNVRNPGRTGDKGRDIIMEKEAGGEEVTYVVECKNLSSRVGRPIIQKLDSATNTLENGNKTRGMVVTTNTFSEQAKEYADKVDVELWDGNKIREIADDVGLDLYNGKIEILCEQSLPLPEDRSKVDEKIIEEFSDLKNFDEEMIDELEIGVEMIPSIHVTVEVNSVMETTVGVVNKIVQRDEFVWRADPESDKQDRDIERLINETEELTRIHEDDLEVEYSDISKDHFEKTETDFKQDIIEYEQDFHRQEVTYTGDNNVTYNKTHEPKKKDIRVEEILPIYIPRINTETTIKEHTHRFSYLTDKKNNILRQDEIHKDTQSESEPLLFSLTVCSYCGTINNKLHIKKERVEKKPICTKCSVKERFMLRKKYFKDEESRSDFEKTYSNMGIHQKLMENKLGLASLTTATITLIATSPTLL